MPLTSAQLTTLKAHIATNTTVLVGGQFNGIAIKDLPNGGDQNFVIAQWYSQTAVPDFKVWRTDTKVTDILDAIDMTKYTPSDSPDATVIYTNRSAAIQIKQMNLQNMLIGRDTVNTAKAGFRTGLRDSVIGVPAGAAGAATAPGGASGVTVLTACTRLANNVEKVLTSGPATTGTVTADVMGFEGAISDSDVLNARNS